MLDLAKLGKLFRGDRSAAQDVDLSHCEPQTMVDSIPCVVGPRIDDQRDTALELIEHMLRSGRADPTEPICARRGQRFSKLAE